MRIPDCALSTCSNPEHLNIGKSAKPVAGCVEPVAGCVEPVRGRAARGVRALCVIGLSLGAAACSTAIPLPSFMGSANDVTGSISPGARLSPGLDVEDWRRAKGALGLALDPQGNGSPVTWDNPRSGAKGSFTPVGAAKPVDERICRAFLAQVGGSVAPKDLQGTACRDKSGEWALDDVKPWSRAG
jgi:surface antigen